MQINQNDTYTKLLCLSLQFLFFVRTSLQINENTYWTGVANNANEYNASNCIEQNDSFLKR